MNLLPRPKPVKPFGQTMLAAAVRAVVCGVLTCAPLAVAGMQPVNMNVVAPEHDEADAVRPPAKGSPAAVLERHAETCWRGTDKPLAELPGHAIVQFTTSGRTVYTADPVLVDAAFAEVLASIGYGDRVSERIDPVALCI